MAVYTKVTFAQAEEFLKNYNLGKLEKLQEITQGVENTNYFVTTSTGKYVLTLFEKRTSNNDLPYFMGLTEHLYNNDITCPQAIYNNDGNNISSLNNRKAVIISFLSGASHMSPSVGDCSKAGEYLAKIHLAQKGYKQKRKNNLSLNGWKEIYSKIIPHLKDNFPTIEKDLEDEIKFLENNMPDNLPKGHIHADFFPDNIFFENSNISGVIDFYFSCYDMLAYDLAITINAWCFDGGILNNKKYEAMIYSYNKIRTLTNLETEKLPILLRGAAIRFLLTRLHDYIFHDDKALLNPKDPKEYIDIILYYRTILIVSS